MPSLEIATELYSDEFAELFEKFETLVSEKAWLNRTQVIAAEIRGNSVLREFLLEENRIAFALSSLSRFKRTYGRFPSPLIASKDTYDACTLVGLFVDIYSKTDDKERKALVGRLRGALGNPDDLRALQFEWLIAVHLSKRGFHIDLSDVTKGGTFDFLAVKDGIETEIECKSISHKRGRQIQRQEALRTLSLFKRDYSSFVKSLIGGLAVRVILQGKLPSSFSEQNMLCKSIRRAILTTASGVHGDAEIRVSSFSLDGSPFDKEDLTHDEIRDYAERTFAIRNREMFSIYRPKHRAFILSLESKDDDDVVGSIFDTIKDACDRQLTRRRPAIICVKLEAIEAEDLREIGEERDKKPSPLRIATSRFLDSRRQSHLIALSFFSEGNLLQTNQGSVTQEGRSYFFRNQDSPLYNSVSESILLDSTMT